MRVTADTKQRTQESLLRFGRKLLMDKGLEGMTTREVAQAAGLAHGTLFNYFPTKEALALAVCGELLAEAEATFARERRGDEDLDELLFAHVAAGLRALAPLRAVAGPLLATALRPVLAPKPAAAAPAAAAVAADADADPYALQARHLDTVRALVAQHRGEQAAGPVALHLYWSLYLGVLAWWSADSSPHQEDALAVLDQSLRMFTASLGAAGPGTDPEPRHGS